MRILGITAEYNPFHNGHLYHVQKARELAQADCTVAVMSGNFTQRGEPAIADKWQRARRAVEVSDSGIDAVFELPFVFACNRAANFAAGGVDMLVRLGADFISFGCEAEDTALLLEAGRALYERQRELEEKARENMQAGISYAKAYETAVREALGEDIAAVIKSPNNILAVEYIRRIEFWKDSGRVVSALPVTRYGSGYNEIGRGYAGASEIRRLMKEGKSIEEYVPGGGNYEPVESPEERLFDALKLILARSSADELAEIYGVGEGLENRIIKEISGCESLEAFLSSLVSRRYTASAVRRILIYILTGLKGREADMMLEQGPGYGRLLAAGAAGREFIRNFSSEDFDIITNVNKYMAGETDGDRMLLHMDIKAADFYNLLMNRSTCDYSDRVIRPFIV